MRSWTLALVTAAGLCAVGIAPRAARAALLPYSSLVLAQNPQIYYQMDEASGPSAADSGSNGVAGTYGTFSLSAAGKWTYSVDNSLAVIQSLGEGLHGINRFSGATILGDGSVSLILDLSALVSESRFAEQNAGFLRVRRLWMNGKTQR